MVALFQKQNSNDSYQIDLMRDFSLLTYNLSDDERAEFASDLQPLLEASDEPLVFETAASLEQKLAQVLQFDSGQSMLNQHRYFGEVVRQAFHLTNHVVRIQTSGAGLFYDFEGERGASASVDYYVGIPQSSSDSKTGLSFASPVSATNALLQARGLAASPMEPGQTLAIQSKLSFDVSDIPFEIFENEAPVQFSGEQIIFIMSQLRCFSKAEASSLLRHVFQMDDLNRHQKKDPYINQVADIILARFDMMGALCEQMDLTAEQVITHLNSMQRIYERRHKEMRSTVFLTKVSPYAWRELVNMKASERFDLLPKYVDPKKYSEGSFYDHMSLLIDSFQNFESYTDSLSFGSEDLLLILQKLHYLTGDQIQSIIEMCEAVEGNTLADIELLSGLAFEDMQAVFADAADPVKISDVWGLQDVFDEYDQKGKLDQFKIHRRYAAQYIEDNAAITHVNAQNASLTMIIESKDERDAVSPTGEHFGLWQVGPKAYKDVVGEDLIPAALKPKVTGDQWQHNIEVGLQYMQHGFDYFNPTESLAVAFGNYNDGQGHMLSYRLNPMYGLYKPRPLNAETRAYLAKYIAMRRMIADHPAYQQVSLN